MNTETPFLLQLKAVLNQNITDPNFGIPELCKSLNISRTHLHRKITESTGLSTSHYIRKLRLEMAKELLETTDLLVYEAADQVGFKDVAYFSTSYLAAFGYSPKDTKLNLST